MEYVDSMWLWIKEAIRQGNEKDKENSRAPVWLDNWGGDLKLLIAGEKTQCKDNGDLFRFEEPHNPHYRFENNTGLRCCVPWVTARDFVSLKECVTACLKLNNRGTSKASWMNVVQAQWRNSSLTWYQPTCLVSWETCFLTCQVMGNWVKSYDIICLSRHCRLHMRFVLSGAEWRNLSSMLKVWSVETTSLDMHWPHLVQRGGLNPFIDLDRCILQQKVKAHINPSLQQCLLTAVMRDIVPSSSGKEREIFQRHRWRSHRQRCSRFAMTSAREQIRSPFLQTRENSSNVVCLEALVPKHQKDSKPSKKWSELSYKHSPSNVFQTK